MPDAGCRMPDAGCRMPDAGKMLFFRGDVFLVCLVVSPSSQPLTSLHRSVFLSNWLLRSVGEIWRGNL